MNDFRPAGGGSGGVPSGAAGGSLTGTYPNPTIATIPSGATATTQSAADASTKVSTTAYVDTGLALKANLAGPTFTGTVTLPHNGTVAVSDLASGIPQSLTSSGSSTKAVADTSAHVIGGTAWWNGTGWIGLGMPSYYINGSNANLVETFPRVASRSATTVALATTGIMSSVAIVLYAGQVVTNISFRVGGTAGSAMTHWWVALYDTQATPALIAQSNDQTSTALGAATNFTIALASPAPYTVVTTGVHYVALMVAATTIPTLLGTTDPGTAINGAIVSGQKVLYQSSGSALTTTAPGTITSPTTLASLPYMAVS